MNNLSALLYTKSTIVSYLRGYLHNSENYEHLLPSNISAEDIKSIKVYDGVPDVLTDFPMIVLSGSNGDIQSLGLADFKHERYNEFGDIIGYTYGGIYNFNLTLEIATLTSFMNEFLSDFIVSALRIYLYRHLEAKGILITSTKYNGDSTTNDKNNIVFISNIGLATWSQWSEYVDLLDIKNINLDIKETEK